MKTPTVSSAFLKKAPEINLDVDLLNTVEACVLLDIKPATLYTYVSRGLLHPTAQAGKTANRYLREEVEGLRVRSNARMGHGAVAANAMRWGQPVISTSVTEITPEGPRYRGHLAADLARYPGAFENVAELLWSGVLSDEKHTWPVAPVSKDIPRALAGMGIERDRHIRMMRVFSVAATALGGGSLTEEVRTGTITQYSRQMIFAFAGCCGLLTESRQYALLTGDKPVAEHIVDALGVQATPELLHVLNAALIMGADHELASPTFAARIAASVGAGLHACIVTALASQSGSGLAGGCDRAEDLMWGITSQAQIKARVGDVARTRERLPGFGLPLYPQGDPRASFLIELARMNTHQTAQSELAFRFIEEVQQQLGIHPNIETGLVALCLTWELPARSASAIWGIGRTAGWIAHVLEQRLAGFVMRPRGQFVQKT
jgi:citrate synthase